ncbi:MAG: large conductance mechanosensitive channel protein MscL [Lachnospiraceae bacterium]|nr:large conductance mechanosensitive channel protein MscL [Lachnospiraceae bacterium]
MAKKDKKGIMEEFKEFAIKGNMIDLAVGMIIGSAFNAIVSSLVKDMLTPLLGLLTGKVDFTQLYIPLDGNTYATLAEAEEAGVACFKYGSFISGLINFLIMAFVVFLFVRGINKVRTKMDEKNKAPEEPKAPTTKICPYCKSEISIEATKCPHCTSELK